MFDELAAADDAYFDALMASTGPTDADLAALVAGYGYLDELLAEMMAAGPSDDELRKLFDL